MALNQGLVSWLFINNQQGMLTDFQGLAIIQALYRMNEW
jgi:hypothetical protein